MPDHVSCGRLSLIALLVFALAPTAAAARESTCPELIKPQPPFAQPSTVNTPPGHLIAVNGDGTTLNKASLAMDFGGERDRDVRTQTFRLSDGLDPRSVRVSTVNDILNGNDPLPIANQQLTYRAGVSPVTELVNVRVCYDPGAVHKPGAGRYVGVLLVSAPGAKAAPLTVEFTFRDDQWLGAVVALIAGILAGVAVQAIAAFQQAPKGTRPKSIWPYLISFRTLLSVAAGVVAAIATYGKVVEGDPTWNSAGPTLLVLAGATFSATLAAKTAIDLKGPTDKEKTKGLAN